MCYRYDSACMPDHFAYEQPAHTVALDAFWIDRTEVTHLQYAQCVTSGVCEAPAYFESYHPGGVVDNVPVSVRRDQAVAYCDWAGARLPTEAEWEYAARGPESPVFPWGDDMDGTRMNYCDSNCIFDGADWRVDDGYPDAAPVGSYPKGASWCGALDLAGNVWEWTADWYFEYPSSHQEKPRGPSSGEGMVVRGGGAYTSWLQTRAAHRGIVTHYGFHTRNIGFRCAMSASD